MPKWFNVKCEQTRENQCEFLLYSFNICMQLGWTFYQISLLESPDSIPLGFLEPCDSALNGKLVLSVTF